MTDTDTELSRADRVFVAFARHVERRVLRHVASQRLLRRIFGVTAQLGARRPSGTVAAQDAQGVLWLRPPGVSGEAPLLMYIHGGGFTIGAPETHAALAAHLGQAAGMRVVLPRYRLAPEHPYPAARDDVFEAWDRLEESGQRPTALAGDSAGGCLALQLVQRLRDAGRAQPRAMGLIGPIGDLSGEVEARFSAAIDEVLIPPEWPRRILTAFLPGVDRDDPAVSPLLGDLSGLPPALIHAAEGEALAQDAMRLEDALGDCLLELWPGLQHVWHLHAGRAPAADRALRSMGAFLARRSRA